MNAELNFLISFQKAVRLTPLGLLPLEKKYIMNEEDFLDALDTITIFTEATKNMVGLRKYQNRKYNFMEEVKLDLEQMFLIGRDEKESALKRKKNAIMYHYVLVPAVDMMKGLSHEEALEKVGDIVAHAKQMIDTHTVKKSFEDAMVVRGVIKLEMNK